MKQPFPSTSISIFLVVYAVLWAAFLPLALLYLLWRGRRDPRYRMHIAERFGVYKTTAKNAVWVHAVSLGEMRSAGPLIKRLIEQGETVVTTHFTPAGRVAAHDLFAAEIKRGELIALYVPLEFDWVFRRFFAAFKPKYGLVMEIEMWPRMIASAHRHDVPLFMCNSQYPEKSFRRDTSHTSIRGKFSRGFAGLMVKSETHAERFRALGAGPVFVTGELRFDQPIAPHLLSAAHELAPQTRGRTVITIASAVIGEDAQYLTAIENVQQYCVTNKIAPPLFIYVPRAPERFDEVAAMLRNEGQNVLNRSDFLDGDLVAAKPTDLATADIFLGDSLGEMYFYLEMSDFVIVGGGFVPKGAHNVIEPLALQKPVLVGPHIWTIEYPAVEAMASGALVKTDTIEALAQTMQDWIQHKDFIRERAIMAKEFFDSTTGATEITLDAINTMLGTQDD